MQIIFNGLCNGALIALLAMALVGVCLQPMACYFMLVVIYGPKTKEHGAAFVPMKGTERSENGMVMA